MSISNAMVRHTLLLSLASIWMRGVSMLFQVWLSRRMGAAGLGLLQLVSTVGMLAATAGTAGVRVAAMYLTAEERGRKNPAGMRRASVCCLRYGFAVSVTVGLVLQFAAPWVSGVLLQEPDAAGALRLFGAFLPLSCLGAVLSGWFTACVKIRQLTLVEIITQPMVLALAALFLSRAQDAAACCRAIMLANGLGETGMLAVLYLLYRRAQKNIPPQNRDGMWRRLLRLCLPLAMSDLLRSGLSTAEQLLIPQGLAASGLAHTGGMAAYGVIHGMVFPVMMFPATLLYALADLLVPELARCDAAGSKARIAYLSRRCLQMGLLFAAFTAGLLYAAAAPLAQLLYADDRAGGYLQLFAPLILMLYLDAIVDAMLKGLGQQVVSVRYNILTSALDIILLLWTLPRWGIDGYFWSFTVSHGINFLLSLRRLLRITRSAPQPDYCLRVITVSALAAILARTVGKVPTGAVSLIFIAGGYTVVFGALCVLWGVVGRQDLQWVRQLLRGSGKD